MAVAYKKLKLPKKNQKNMMFSSFVIISFIILYLSFNMASFQKKYNKSVEAIQNRKKIQKYIIDYDGDGKSDISVYSIKEHILYIKDHPNHKWKFSFDIPLPILGDYDGDLKTDIAFYDKGFWHIFSYLLTKLGKRGDIPVPGDYDGDAKTDIAIWRPNKGAWLFSIKKDIVIWGEIQDIPVPMDYNGDGITDIAVWRPSSGKWYIKSSSGETSVMHWGTAGDIPVPGDFNGDGKCDIAVWRPSDGIWYIKGQDNYQFGARGDIPVPGDYDGDGVADIAVWKSSDGLWLIKDQKKIKFGSSQDIPMSWNIWILWTTKILGHKK